MAISVNGPAAREIRLRLGATQVAIASEAGISQSFLSELETGEKRNMDAPKFLGLCRALRITDQRAILADPHGVTSSAPGPAIQDAEPTPDLPTPDVTSARIPESAGSSTPTAAHGAAQW